jgi:uncharacterized protein YjbI with pentapeptide repeats
LLHKENPVIDLTGADLSGIDLHNNNLSGGGAFLMDFSLYQAASLKLEPGKAANLRGAILSDANMERAMLDYTDLTGADLSDADLSHASLSKTDLTNANLSDANLSHVFLNQADLLSTDLSDANLNDANLNDASGITNEELEQRAASLEGATMPNGQKYEEWLKDREFHKEDGENDGSP